MCWPKSSDSLGDGGGAGSGSRRVKSVGAKRRSTVPVSSSHRDERHANEPSLDHKKSLQQKIDQAVVASRLADRGLKIVGHSDTRSQNTQSTTRKPNRSPPTRGNTRNQISAEMAKTIGDDTSRALKNIRLAKEQMESAQSSEALRPSRLRTEQAARDTSENIEMEIYNESQTSSSRLEAGPKRVQRKPHRSLQPEKMDITSTPLKPQGARSMPVLDSPRGRNSKGGYEQDPGKERRVDRKRDDGMRRNEDQGPTTPSHRRTDEIPTTRTPERPAPIKDCFNYQETPTHRAKERPDKKAGRRRLGDGDDLFFTPNEDAYKNAPSTEPRARRSPQRIPGLSPEYTMRIPPELRPRPPPGEVHQASAIEDTTDTQTRRRRRGGKKQSVETSSSTPGTSGGTYEDLISLLSTGHDGPLIRDGDSQEVVDASKSKEKSTGSKRN